MNLANNYWYFDAALSPKFCDDLVKYGNSQQDALALTGSHSEKKIKVKS